MQHGRVNGPGVVEKFSDNTLEEFLFLVRVFVGCVLSIGELDTRAIGGGGPLRWGLDILFGWGDLEMMEGISNIVWHGQVDRAILVVPLERDATIFGGLPVNSDS